MRVGGRHLTGAHFKHRVARCVEIKPGSGVVKFEIGECDEMPQGAFFAVFARMPYYDGFQLLHGDGLGQVAGLVDIAAALEGYVIGEQLGGHGVDNRAYAIVNLGHCYYIVGNIFKGLREASYRNYRAFSRLYLLGV